MTVSPNPNEIRSIVMATLRGLGASKFREERLDETILVQEGRCMARSYRWHDYFAMWLVDVGLLQFYDADGDMLLVINLLEEAAPQRLAA